MISYFSYFIKYYTERMQQHESYRNIEPVTAPAKITPYPAESEILHDWLQTRKTAERIPAYDSKRCRFPESEPAAFPHTDFI